MVGQGRLMIFPAHGYGKSPCVMEKLTNSMAIFNSELLVFQRLYHFIHLEIWVKYIVIHYINYSN